jgi:hypothetical protein
MLNKSEKVELNDVIENIKNKGHAKLHNNKGSMSNRISLSVYESLINKDDYEKYFHIIKNNVYKH